ncbi:hypothetical protein STPH1_6667 [Streptomyces sp. OM5714]|nr:hypothetical protein STPH1_6667 [Streptomyces sp. OM5714]
MGGQPGLAVRGEDAVPQREFPAAVHAGVPGDKAAVPADALQDGDGERQRVRLARGELRRPPVGVAAEGHAPQARVGAGGLRDPAHRGRAHPGPLRQPVQGEPVRTDERAPHVVPLQERGEHRAGGRRPVGGHVLDAVHRGIRLARQQRGVDLR